MPRDLLKHPRRRWSMLALLAAAACLLGLAFARLGPQPAGSEALAPPREERSVATARAESAAALEGEGDGAPENRQALAPAAEEPEAPRRPGQAKLRVRAVDAQSGESLDRLRVRAASASRFADREAPGSAELALTLTPDSYELLLLSRGYEPLALPAVELVAGASVALDPIRLAVGSARIVGVAHGDPAGLRVELLGEGRRPCALCLDVPTFARSTPAERNLAWNRSEPCPACGFSAKATLHALAPDGRFTLDRLVSGRYALRLVDAQQHTFGLPQSFELRAGETLALEFDAGQTTLELEVLDVDGTSLSGVWAGRMNGATRQGGEALPEFEIVESSGVSRPFACAFQAGEVGIARATLVPPAPANATASSSTSVSVGFHGRRVGGGPASGVDDRARRKSDALRPESPAPPIPVPVIACVVGADGLARFDPLPAIALTLELSCGPYRAAVALAQVQGRQRVRVRLVCETVPPDTALTFLEYEAGGRR